MSFPVLKLLFSLGILVAGAALAWFYVRKPSIPHDARARVLGGRRPWRRLGGAICLLLAVMFVLGVYVVDVPDNPRVYLAYWTVMMGLVLWLCVLATKDIFYTRRIIARRRDGKARPSESRSARHISPVENRCHSARKEPKP